MSRSSDTNYFTAAELGLALRWLREVRVAMTREKVAQQSGISSNYLRKLERGERQTIARDKLATLLVTLRSDLTSLEAILSHRPWQHGSSLRIHQSQVNIPDPDRKQAAEGLDVARETKEWPEDSDQNKLLYGEVLELVERYLRLSPEERARLLDDLRR